MSEETPVLDQDANDPVDTTDEVIDVVADEVEETPEADPVEEKAEEVEETTEETPEPEAKADEAPEEREVYTMPVAKAQEEKRKAVEKAKAEAEAELKKLRAEYEDKLANSTPKEFDLRLAQFSEKHGLDKEAAKGLLDLFKEDLPDFSRYENMAKEQEKAVHYAKARDEFDAKVLPLIQKDFPGVSNEHVQKVKEKVVELAFSKGYNTYRLEDIYAVKKGDFTFKNQMSAEPSGGRNSQLTTFKKLSDSEEIKLADRDPEGYEQYLKWLNGQESKFVN